MINMRYFLIVLAVSLSVVGCIEDELNQTIPKDETFDPNWGQGDSIPIVGDYYFAAKIDSSYRVYQTGIEGYDNTVDSLYYGKCGDSNVYVGQTSLLSKDSLEPGSIELNFVSCMPDSSDSIANAANVFLGSYSYGSSKLSELADGIEVRWTDMNGREWRSLKGSGQNVDNQFTIYRIDPSPDQESDLIIWGTINMRLYSGIDYVPIENGEFVMRIGKF